VREAATALGIGKSTANRCFDRLHEVGFVKIGKRSGFSMKGRVSTEWLLTEFPDDTKGISAFASKDFMKWVPEKLNNSPTSRPHSPAMGTVVSLTWDRVAVGQR
jgi:hypothetical protein